MKKRLFLLLLTSYIAIHLPLSAYDVPEISIGLRVGGEAHQSTAPLLALENEVDFAINPFDWGANANVGLVLDIKTRSWFSFSSQITMAIARSLTDDSTSIKAIWQDFNFDFLAKFHVGFWFIGIGPGFSLSTPAIYRTKNNHLNSTVGNLGDNLEDLGLQPKVSTRFTTTLETGVYVPINVSKVKIGYVTVSVRSVVAPMTLEKVMNMKYCANGDEVRAHYLGMLANKSSTLFSTGLFIGYNHILN